MRMKKLTVLANALVLSAALFANAIVTPSSIGSINGCSWTGEDAALQSSSYYDMGRVIPCFRFNGETEPKATGTNEAFLRGLSAFGLTAGAGILGLIVGGQIGEGHGPRIVNGAIGGAIGSLVGAGVSQILSLGHDSAPTDWGDWAGFGAVTLLCVVMYPDLLAAIFIWPFIPLLRQP